MKAPQEFQRPCERYKLPCTPLQNILLLKYSNDFKCFLVIFTSLDTKLKLILFDIIFDYMFPLIIKNNL